MPVTNTKISDKNVSTSAIKGTNPFPGLRPFSTTEAHLFFGRDEEGDTVRERLLKNRIVIISGNSGSGKTSLVNAGVIPGLFKGDKEITTGQWRIITSRPGNAPIANLARELSVSAKDEQTNEELRIQTSINKAILNRTSFGLIEVIKQLKLSTHERLLLVIDQFEELFRYKKSKTAEPERSYESDAYVSLLTNAMISRDIPVYLIINIRSEYTGRCSQYEQLSELMNKSSYLLKLPDRNECREVILGPVAVVGGSVEKQFIQKILNDIVKLPDQLPIMQHALLRTWEHHFQKKDIKTPLSVSDYDATGGVQNALSIHANEAFRELDEKGRRICEKLFKTITEKGEDSLGVRRPSTVREIASIAGVTAKEVLEVVEIFRSSGRSFLTPASPDPIDAESIIDITHESLIRNWEQLGKWVDEEATSVQMYSRLAEKSALYQTGKTSLLIPPLLHLAISWREKEKPTLPWARRFNPAFERSMVYLKTSEEEYLQQEEEERLIKEKKIRRNRRNAVLLGAVAITALILMILAGMKTTSALKQRNALHKQIATLQSEKEDAEQRAKEAVRQQEIAKKALVEAELQKIVAEKQTEISDVQLNQAQQNAEEAMLKQEQASQNIEELEQQKQQALQTAAMANRQSQIADQKSQEAYKRRMIALAQTMAVKSIQINNDDQLKGLVAYQAYLFNEQYNGPEFLPEMYQSMYTSLQALNPEIYAPLKGPRGAVNALVFAPDRRILYSTGGDGNLYRWDLTGSHPVRTTLISNAFINRSLAISNNNKWLACGTANSIIQLFDLSSGSKSPIVLQGHNGIVGSLVFTPDNQFLISVCTDDRSVRIWRLSDQSSTVIATTESRVRSIDVSPNGNIIAGGTEEGSILLWDRNNNNLQQTFANDAGNSFYTVTFSHDGRYLAAGDKRGHVDIWNLASGKKLYELSGQSARIMDVKFSPDNSLIAACSYDGTVAIRKMDQLSGSPIILNEHHSWVLAVAFSPDGSLLASSSDKGEKILLSPSSPEKMADYFCNNLSRNMTRSEWSTYVAPDIPYEKTCKNLSSIENESNTP